MIYDVLNATAGTFTVNTAVKQVALSTSTQTFVNSAGNNTFADGDNVFLRSVRIVPPYQFGNGEGIITGILRWYQAGATPRSIFELADGGLLTLNPPMIALTPEIQLQYRLVGGGTNVLQHTGIGMNVSQLNVPALINGTVQTVKVFLEIAHTKPLT